MKMVQSILILSDLVAITGVLSKKNVLEIIRVGAIFSKLQVNKKVIGGDFPLLVTLKS